MPLPSCVKGELGGKGEYKEEGKKLMLNPTRETNSHLHCRVERDNA